MDGSITPEQQQRRRRRPVEWEKGGGSDSDRYLAVYLCAVMWSMHLIEGAPSNFHVSFITHKKKRKGAGRFVSEAGERLFFSISSQLLLLLHTNNFCFFKFSFLKKRAAHQRSIEPEIS